MQGHSTLSKNHHGRFRDSDLVRVLFETVVARFIEESRVGGKCFATDANVIGVDANKQNLAAKEDWDRDIINLETFPVQYGIISSPIPSAYWASGD